MIRKCHMDITGNSNADSGLSALCDHDSIASSSDLHLKPTDLSRSLKSDRPPTEDLAADTKLPQYS